MTAFSTKLKGAGALKLQRQEGCHASTWQPSCWMARLAGFEPTTPWFVAKYSIQLSYIRQAEQYNSPAPASRHALHAVRAAAS